MCGCVVFMVFVILDPRFNPLQWQFAWTQGREDLYIACDRSLAFECEGQLFSVTPGSCTCIDRCFFSFFLAGGGNSTFHSKCEGYLSPSLFVDSTKEIHVSKTTNICHVKCCIQAFRASQTIPGVKYPPLRLGVKAASGPEWLMLSRPFVEYVQEGASEKMAAGFIMFHLSHLSL